eukprot:scaffold170276_cov41-Prasinocladus_malaysianus.AAC.1
MGLHTWAGGNFVPQVLTNAAANALLKALFAVASLSTASTTRCWSGELYTHRDSIASLARPAALSSSQPAPANQLSWPSIVDKITR